MKHKPIVTVADLINAIRAGWQLEEVAKDMNNGFHTCSSDYALRRGNVVRGGLKRRVISEAIRRNRIELAHAAAIDAPMVWQIKRAAKPRRTESAKR